MPRILDSIGDHFVACALRPTLPHQVGSWYIAHFATAAMVISVAYVHAAWQAGLRRLFIESTSTSVPRQACSVWGAASRWLTLRRTLSHQARADDVPTRPARAPWLHILLRLL